MIRKRFFTGCLGLAMLLTSGWAFAQDAKAQEAKAPEYVLKVYRVSDLFTPRPDYPYRGGLPTTGTADQPSSSSGMTGMGGMMGGMGGSGGSSMQGGGGFFQVPDPIQVTQLGGGAEGMGGMGPMGGGFAPGLAIDGSLRFNLDELIQAIVSTVMPETWTDNGGEAVCTPLGGLLLIKQTAAAHTQIEQLLNDIRTEGGSLHTVTVEATWLSLTSEDVEKLAPKGNGEGGESTTVDAQVLKDLARQNLSHQGRVSCYNDQTVHLVSGTRRTLIVNATPSVGFGSVGYSPQVAIPNVGLLLQVRPTVDPNRKSAVLNVTSTLTEWQDPGEAVTIKSDSEPASKEGMTTQGASSQITLDRVNLKTQQLGTTVRVPVGQPVLVGGMSLVGEDPKDADGPEKQLYLIVKLTLNEAPK